jgi:hypothetical protein
MAFSLSGYGFVGFGNRPVAIGKKEFTPSVNPLVGQMKP